MGIYVVEARITMRMRWISVSGNVGVSVSSTAAGWKNSRWNREAAVNPLLRRRGGRDIKKISPKAPFDWSGRGGQKCF